MGMGQHHLVPMIARYGALFPDVVIELTLSQRNPDMLEEGQDVLITGERQLPDSGSSPSAWAASTAYSAPVPATCNSTACRARWTTWSATSACACRIRPLPEGLDLRRRAGRAHRQPAEHLHGQCRRGHGPGGQADSRHRPAAQLRGGRGCATASCYGCCPAMPCTSGPSMRCIPRGVTWTRRSAPGSICCNRNFPRHSPATKPPCKVQVTGHSEGLLLLR